ncbi:MAG TPA: tetratricopeptide repeat protein [Candidatus Angelobacter sp.]|nr:tetratricopeptide repeat protein [Candidatus Angelobacter sp.]
MVIKTALFISLILGSKILGSCAAQAQEAQPDICPRDDSAFADVQKKASANDPVAQTALASCYDLGLHVQANGKESIRLLTKAAEKGYAHAEYEIGRIYLYGRGIPADYAKALVWETRAAEQGDPRAQRDLAFMYERGFGVPADPAKAAEWNRKAAGNGNSEAQLQLARALDQGSGINKNQHQARQWYAKAAAQDQPEAQLELARQLAQKGDCSNAIRWYQRSAAHGETTAMFELGWLYLEHKCAGDSEKALEWFTIGARSGSKECASEVEKLSRSLPAAGRKRAQLAAAKWMKSNPAAEEDDDAEEKH